MLLIFYYQPTRTGAYSSILALESMTYGGAWLRNLHWLGSNVFLGLMFLHTLRVILTGAYRHPRHLNWIIGCALLFLGITEAYFGLLLPLDQLAVWAGQTGMELLQSLPFGKIVYRILAPDGTGQTLTILRTYVLHIIILPGMILGLSFLHFYRVRQNKGTLPYL